jgi:hypothetical protein|tara:strand:- start:335 stop:718 length:384 start_codon:yes stop_codon:yes gene_type:complete
MMKIKLDDTYIDIELSSYDKHLHGKHVKAGHRKPYCVAYIQLKSDERFEPLKDKLEALVYINLMNYIEPALEFNVVEYDVDNVSSNNVTGGYSHEKIDELMRDLSDGIRYHEINPLYGDWDSRSSTL